MLYFNISASKKAYTYFKEIAMNNMLKERVLVLANYIDQTGHTIRQTAKHFGLSKSTVGYDVCHRLPKINFVLYLKIKAKLFKNFQQKYIQGGKATAQKYLAVCEKSNNK